MLKNAKEPIVADKSRSSTVIDDKDSNEQAYRNEAELYHAAAAMNKGGQSGEAANWEEQQAPIQEDIRGWPEHNNEEKSETMT